MIAEPRGPKTLDILACALDRTPGVARVPFVAGEDLPGTVRPTSTITPAFPTDHGHIAVHSLVHDFEGPGFRGVIADMVCRFLAAVAASGAAPGDFRPLPHCPPGYNVDYLPAEIRGIPVRWLMSYSAMQQSLIVSLDAQIAAPRSEPSA